MKHPASRARITGIALAALLTSTASHAVSHSFSSSTDGNWSNGALWSTAVVGGPNAAGDIAQATNAGSARIATLDVAATVGIIRNANTGSRHWTIQDDANHFSLTLDNTGGTGNSVIESASNTSAITVNADIIIANTDLNIRASGTTTGSGAANVGVLGVNTITATSTRAINLKADGIKAVTVNSSIGATGSTINLFNSGTGTATATINGALGANVASINQNSATSLFVVKGDNSAFTGNTIVTAGRLSIGTAYTMAGSSNNSISLTGMASPVAGTHYGQILVTAGTTSFGGSLTLNFTGTAVEGATVYDLFTTSGTGALSGSFTSVSVAGGYIASLTNSSGVWTGSTLDGFTSFSFSQATGDLTVTASAVPEPSTFAALAGLVSLGVVALRRRRS